MAISDLPEGELTAAASVPAEGVNEAKARRVSVTKLASLLHGLVQPEASPEPAGLHVGVSDGFAETRSGLVVGQDMVVMLHPMAAAVRAPPVTPELTWAAPDTATAGIAITGTITASGAASGPWSLNVPAGWTVSPSSGSSVAPGSPVSVNITPTAGSQDLVLTCAGASITGNPQNIVASAPGGSLTVGAQITSLAVTSESGSGSRPFAATVLPLRGAVPSGERLTDSTGAFDSTVLSAHDDGSAAVVVVSGTASGTGLINLHRATGSTTALTAAAIGALVTSVEVAFGAPYGTASLTDFSTPERTWWANSKTICARYRVAAPTPGSTALEAVIDVHAWAGRALVEVTVENSKFDAAASTSSTKPAAATYAGAVLTVNGSTAATVASSVFAEGNHGPFRAWYASTWIGGDPGLRVVQAASDLQAHPLLFLCDQAATFDMAGYASDAYTPGGTGRHRATNMGGTGDHESIGPLPLWESRALQSGDYRAWQATEASALSILSYNVNHRDSVTGRVPDSSLMSQKCQGSFWANWPKNTEEPAFEVAHQPAAGLMAFIGRPSPVFIEIAQKVAVWTGTVDSTRDLFNNFNESAVGITDSTGIVGNQQIRSKAWGPRNIAHATFLSPDVHPWKAGGREWLDRNTRYLESYAANTRNVLLPLWEGEPDAPSDVDGSQSGYQVSLWMYHFCVTEWHKIAASRLLAGISGARQTAVDTVADGLALPVVKWVNEQSNGGWRFLPYRTRLGDTSGTMTTYSTWTAQRAADLSGAPSTVTGQFSGASVGSETTWAAVEALGYESAAYSSSLYTANFWAALMAAHERGVANSETALQTVLNGITNLSTWRVPFGSDPRWGALSKDYVPVPNDVTGHVWTPTKDGSGNILSGSWANLPLNEWCRVAGTSFDGIKTLLLSGGFDITSGTYNKGTSKTVAATFNKWVGVAVDQASGNVYNYAGGGHNDSSVNGVWRLKLERMAWDVPGMPSVPDAPGFVWSTTYKAGPFTQYTPIPGGEPTYGPSGEGNYDVLPDSTPTSRHNYGGVWWDSDRSMLVQSRTSRWDFNPATGAHTRQRWNNGTSDYPVYTGDAVVYHAGSSRAYGRFPSSDNAYTDFGYVPGGSNVITRISAATPANTGAHSLCKIDADTALMTNNDGVNSSARYGVLDMAAGTFTSSGGISNGLNSNQEMPACVVIPGTQTAIRRVWVGSGNVQWRQLDLSTMTESAHTPAGNVPPWVDLVGNKFFAYEARNVLVYLSTADDSSDVVYVMRYA